MKQNKILVVDDEKEVLELLEKKLITYGYNVLKANNGQDALLMAKMQQPGLILLDIMMPRMDGADMAKALKKDKRTENIPVIFMSGIVTKEDEKNVEGGITVDGQAYKMIAKPFNFAELLNEIRRVLS